MEVSIILSEGEVIITSIFTFLSIAFAMGVKWFINCNKVK